MVVGQAAVTRIAQAWDGLRQSFPADGRTDDLCDFIDQFASAVPAPYRRSLLEMLISNHSVVDTGAVGLAPTFICHGLRRVGLVRQIRVANRTRRRLGKGPRLSALRFHQGRTVLIRHHQI
jgi:hypothetical protein